MSKRAPFWVAVIAVFWIGGVFGQPSRYGSSVAFQTAAVTTSQTAVFAPFLAWAGPVETAISVSNVLAAPLSLGRAMDEAFSDRVGTLEFYLWGDEMGLIVYETGPVSPGVGLGPDGTLAPGETYRVLLSEILASAGFKGGSFFGYGWVVANFDGVQGTANVTDFSTFTQTTVMQPDIGSAFFEKSGSAGIPVFVPPDEEEF